MYPQNVTLSILTIWNEFLKLLYFGDREKKNENGNYCVKKMNPERKF